MVVNKSLNQCYVLLIVETFNDYLAYETIELYGEICDLHPQLGKSRV